MGSMIFRGVLAKCRKAQEQITKEVVQDATMHIVEQRVTMVFALVKESGVYREESHDCEADSAM